MWVDPITDGSWCNVHPGGKGKKKEKRKQKERGSLIKKPKHKRAFTRNPHH